MESVNRLYNIKEFYWALYKALLMVPKLIHARKKGEISPEFMERIMLAVTEVNGCAACSYAHTKIALETGMSNEGIQKLLSGVVSDIPEQELPAILFAQHYAENRDFPSTTAWDRIVEIYGLSKAMGILAAIRLMIAGNIYGIPWSSFFNRFRGKPDERSSLFYEISLLLIGPLFIPVAIVHSAITFFIKKRSKFWN